MTPNIPIIGAIASIQAVDVIPSDGFDWAKLAVQLILGIIGFFNHRKLAKQAKEAKENTKKIN